MACGFKSPSHSAGGLGPSLRLSRVRGPAVAGTAGHWQARRGRPGPQAGTVTSQAWVGAAGVTVTLPPGRGGARRGRRRAAGDAAATVTPVAMPEAPFLPPPAGQVSAKSTT